MSIFTGVDNSGLTVTSLLPVGDIDMKFSRVKNLAAPLEKHDAVSMNTFIQRHSVQNLEFRFPGMLALGVTTYPNYRHSGNGTGIFYTPGFTDNTHFFLKCISFDNSDPDYNMRVEIRICLIYADGTKTTSRVSGGEITFRNKLNLDIDFNDVKTRFIELNISTPIKLISSDPTSIRFVFPIMIMRGGKVNQQKSVIQCEIREY